MTMTVKGVDALTGSHKEHVKSWLNACRKCRIAFRSYLCATSVGQDISDQVARIENGVHRYWRPGLRCPFSRTRWDKSKGPWQL